MATGHKNSRSGLHGRGVSSRPTIHVKRCRGKEEGRAERSAKKLSGEWQRMARAPRHAM